jgi:hypothetical protein
MAYATITELQQRIGFPDATDAALVARLTDALDAATTAIDNDTGRSFATSASITRTFGAPAASRVLRVPDLVSVTTLKVDDDDDGTFEITIASTDYELDTVHPSPFPYDTVRLTDRSFPGPGLRRRRVEITGVWGWSAVPDPINQACTLLAGRIAQRSSQALFGTQSFGDLGAASIRSSDPDYMALIARYRLIGVA